MTASTDPPRPGRPARRAAFDPADDETDLDRIATRRAFNDSCFDAPEIETGVDDDQPARSAGTVSGLRPACTDDDLAAWIDRIVDQDERALSALYDATAGRVYALVLRIVRRPAWAEEVVEDVFFQVWRQAVRFDPARGRAMTWLLAMARSRALDALRHESRHDHDPIDVEDDDPLPDAGRPGCDQLLAMVQGHAELHLALARLAAQPRQLVALAFFRGLSHEEIAEQTALPLGTVKSQIRRALSALEDVLGDSGLQALPS
jgi:RNA polymerase sigma factor (sigma-70 family)